MVLKAILKCYGILKFLKLIKSIFGLIGNECNFGDIGIIMKCNIVRIWCKERGRCCFRVIVPKLSYNLIQTFNLELKVNLIGECLGTKNSTLTKSKIRERGRFLKRRRAEAESEKVAFGFPFHCNSRSKYFYSISHKQKFDYDFRHC